MKKVILFSSVALLVANILAGLLLSAYDTFNVVASSIIVVLTAVLLYATTAIQIKDAFRVSLNIIFAFIGLTLYIMMLFAPHHIKDNWAVIVSIVLFIIEIIVLYLANWISKKNV